MADRVPLVPCDGCRRHIRADHDLCPFCTAHVPVGFVERAVPAATKRLDRLAMFTFATALTVGACGGLDDASRGEEGDSGTPRADAGADTAVQEAGVPVPMYGGGIPVDAGRDGATTRDASAQDGAVDDDGGSNALYGLPPPPFDASLPDANAVPAYGLPPIDGG